MGLFYVGCRVLNPVTSKSVAVRRLMVDTRAEATWISAAVLEAIGIERRKKDLPFQLAKGQIITRSVGYAVLTVDKSETVDEVVFAETGDLQLLGARALEGLNLQVDARRKKLVAAGPIVSAAAVPPRFGRLVQVSAPKVRGKTHPTGTVAPDREPVDGQNRRHSFQPEYGPSVTAFLSPPSCAAMCRPAPASRAASVSTFVPSDVLRWRCGTPVAGWPRIRSAPAARTNAGSRGSRERL